MPSSPRGWFCRASYTLGAQARPFSCKLEYDGWTDRRMNDSRETALSVKIMAERASHAVCGNGVGYALLMRFYAGDASWWSFTEPEQFILRKTIRHFARALREAGFLPREEKEIIP